MDKFTGTIIEESLEDTGVLNKVKIVSTRISPVTDKNKTPWLKEWTLHKVEIEPDQVQGIAGEISTSLDKERIQSWYADFKNESQHYIIFRDKVFKIDRTKNTEYQEAEQYGLELGIPEYQLGFSKFIIR